jgi:hypothetical protein
MKQRVQLIGLFVWLALIGVGMRWAGNPVLRPPGNAIFRITAEDARRAFPIRLTPLPAPAPPPVAAPPGKPGAKTVSKRQQFDYESWSWRETKRRLGTFFIAWCVLGVAIQWGVPRFLDKQRKSG